MIMILTEINRNMNAPHAPTISKFLKLLPVQTGVAAGKIQKLVGDIEEALQILPRVNP